MVREDIEGILRVALQQGKNFQQIIQSLYNSGYSKDEVDEAAKILNASSYKQPSLPMAKSSPTIIQQPKPVQPVPKEQLPKGQTQQIVSAYPYPVQQPQTYQPQPVSPPIQQSQPVQFYQPAPYPVQFVQFPQIISNYGQPKKFSMGKTITIIMVVMLMILLGILAVVIMFKPQLENFINNL
jgi:hypothetical protein